MKKALSVLVLAILAIPILVNLASAQEIKNFQIKITIEGSNAEVSYQIESDLQEISFSLPRDAVITYCSENYTSKNNIIYVNSAKNLTLKYLTKEYIENHKYFTANFQIGNSEKASIELILPKSSTLGKSYPDARLTSDGTHIILNWEADNKSNFPVFASYHSNENINSLEIILILIAGGLIVALILLKKKTKPMKVKKSKKEPNKLEIHLLESESAVVNALKDGEVWQKQIQLKTGFSKAKLSRIIRDLEARGLIKKIPLGNTNKIRLLNK